MMNIILQFELIFFHIFVRYTNITHFLLSEIYILRNINYIFRQNKIQSGVSKIERDFKDNFSPSIIYGIYIQAAKACGLQGIIHPVHGMVPIASFEQ